MPISLQEFATGDTNYIGKHNANIAALVAFLNSLEVSFAQVSGPSSGLKNSTNIGKATYGDEGGMYFIGSESFAMAGPPAGGAFTLQPGYTWDSYYGYMHYKPDETRLDFQGWPVGTYYVRFDADGTPFIDDLPDNAIYEVVWYGMNTETEEYEFGEITTLATVVPTNVDIAELAYSPNSGITYPSVQERFTKMEESFAHLFPVNMAIASYVVPVDVAMEHAGFHIEGAMTVDTYLTLPAKKKLYFIKNDCTTATENIITVRVGEGAGVALEAGENAILYCDGTVVLVLVRQRSSGPVTAIEHLDDVPSYSGTGMGLRLLRVREDQTGTEWVTPESAMSVTALAVADEGGSVDSDVAMINFEGGGVTVTQTAAGQVKVTIPGAGGEGGGGLTVQEEGVSVDPAVLLINFAGDGVTVSQTASGQVLVTIPGAGGGSADYDISFFIADKRPAGAVAFRHTFTKAVDFQANFAGCDTDAVAAATATAVFPIKKNGTQVGALTFAAGGAGTFSTVGGVALSFLAGDILEFVAPDPQDATLSGVSVTLSGTRS